MYHQSFQDMQVDYFDYYLLHAIGGGGIKVFNERYTDNGVLDFLLKEREPAGFVAWVGRPRGCSGF